MRSVFRFMCFMLFVSAGPASLARGAVDVDQLAIPHETFVLENGLTVIVHEDHSVPIVAVNLWYHVGSRNESRGRTGFAHLFEHFFFNGSEHYPHDFRRAMDDVGANNRNGTTNPDRTNFFEDVPVSALERTLYLEADRMGFLAANITQETLDQERGIVQNEKRQGENQPYGKVWNRIVESIYPYSHPYSWPIIGSMADLEAATLDDVKAWYAKYYGPSNCVLSLAGDITVEQARELVGKYFAGIPPGPPVERYRQWVPTLERPLRDMMHDRVPQARIYRVYHTPGWLDAESVLIELNAGLLSGSRSAPLDRALVYDKQVATEVAAFAWDKEIAGNLVVVVSVKPGVDPADAERELDAVMAQFLGQKPARSALDRARTRQVAQFIRGMERLGGFGGRSDILAESMTYAGDPEAFLQRYRKVMEATPAELHAASTKWLDANHYTLTVLPFPELKAAAEDVDRTSLPALGPAPEVAFPEIGSRELDNGLRVLLLERRGAPLVNMSLAVDAGYAADPAAAAGTASLALQLLEEGTRSRDGFALADDLDALGATISSASSLDLSFVQLRALKANLARSLAVFADVVRNPAFAGDMVALGKRRRLAQIAQEEAQPFSAALRMVPPLLYGDGHVYAKPLTGSGYVETVRNIEPDDLSKWHSAWFRPNNATLIVTGDVTFDDLMPMVDDVLGDWKPGAVPLKRVADVPRGKAGRIYLVDRPDASQSVIVAAQASIPGGQAEEVAIEAAMRAFGGMSTSRFNQNLRIDKHWSYGVFGALLDARGHRPLLVVAPVQTDRTADSMAEIVGEFRSILGDRPIAGEEFASLKRNMELRLPGRFETLASLEDAAHDLVNYGYSPAFYYDYAKTVRALGEQDLAEAVNRVINPEQLIWVVVGDLEKIEAQVRALGFGEVVRLKASGASGD